MPDPVCTALEKLLTEGQTRVPEAWDLTGPEQAGLWWRASSSTVVGTPALVQLSASFAANGEAIAAVLATVPRYREAWLGLQAARLRALGERNAVDELLRAIDAMGTSAAAIRSRLSTARIAPTPFIGQELPTLGAPADQAGAAPALLRVLANTSRIVEGGLGIPVLPLPEVHPTDPAINWQRGRLLQAPAANPAIGGAWVLSGAVSKPSGQRMNWVLGTPWATLLAVLAFTAEAWGAERHGGVQFELPSQQIASFAAPQRVDVVVNLADGREVLCGSLGGLCLRTLDALGMAIVPWTDAETLDRELGPVIGELLASGVWAWQSIARPRYVIGDSFGYDCYRGDGHRFIYLGADTLSQTLRSVCVAWARERAEFRP